jgi:hypothetical protein
MRRLHAVREGIPIEGTDGDHALQPEAARM